MALSDVVWRLFISVAAVCICGVTFFTWLLPGGGDSTLGSALSGYAACIGSFLDDVQSYEDCLSAHAGKKCYLDDKVMTTWHDAAICMSVIAPTENLTGNAVVIEKSHHVCYKYVNTMGECFGRAVQLLDLETCLRKEVLARFGYVLEACRNQTGGGDGEQGNVDGLLENWKGQRRRYLYERVPRMLKGGRGVRWEQE